jgi:hypothetical protein
MRRLLLISTIAVSLIVGSSWFDYEYTKVLYKCEKTFLDTFSYVGTQCLKIKEDRECIVIAIDVADKVQKRCLNNNLIYKIKRLFTL